METDRYRQAWLAGALFLTLAGGAEAQTLTQLRDEFEALYARNPASEVCYSSGNSVDFRMIHTEWFPGTNNLVTVELTPQGIDLFVLDTAHFGPNVTVTEAHCIRGSTYRVGIMGTQPFKCRTRLSDSEEASLAAQAAWCIAAFNIMPFLLESGGFFFEFADPVSARRAADLLSQIISMT